MADKQLQFKMIFTAEASEVKQASQDAKQSVQSVATEADRTSAALDKHAAALDRDATAARSAAEAARALAAAEQDARNKVSEARAPQTVVRPTTSTVPQSSVPSQPFAPSAVPPSSSSRPAPAGGEDLEALRSKYDALYAAQRNYEQGLADLNTLQAAGTVSAEQAITLSGRLTAAYDNQVKSIAVLNQRLDENGTKTKLTSQEQSLLFHNVRDAAQGVALGMSPSMIIFQQGPQIIDLYGGIGNAAKAAAGLITGVNLAIVAGAAVVVGGTLAWLAYRDSIDAVNKSAAGVGRAVASTSADMENAAREGASTANISIKSARAMEAQFLSTGKIGAENFQKLIAVSKDFAFSTGADAETIGDTLSQLFSDPAKAAQTLYRQYGLIDGATADLAQHLAAQNKTSEAQAVILDALPARLAKAAEATTAWAKTWQTVSTYASAAYDKVGKAIDRRVSGVSVDEQLDDAKAKLAGETKTRDRALGSTASTVRGFFGFNSSGQDDVDKAQAEVDRLQKIVDDQNAKKAKIQEDLRRQQDGANAVSIAQQSPANSRQNQILQFRDSIAALQQGNDPNSQSPEQQQSITDAIKAKQTAMEGLEHQQERQSRLDQLDISIQNEKNPVLRAQLVQQREKISLSLQEVNATDAAMQAQRAGNAVINEAIAGGAAQARDMQTEIAIRRSLTTQVAAGTITSDQANSKLQEELALHPLVLAAATAEAQGKTELYKQLMETISQLRAGYDGLAQTEKEATAASYIRSQQDGIDSLKAQLSVVGESEQTQARILAQVQAEQQIRSMGLDATSEQAQKIRSVAAEQASLNTQLVKSKDAWNDYKQAGSDAIDTIFGGLADGDKIGDIAKTLGTSLKKTALQLGVENPLKNALFGTNLGTFSDLFSGQKSGGVLDSLGKSVGAMNVTATTVMINGGVTGALGTGLGGTSANTSLFGGAANSNSPIASGDISSFASAIKAVESGGNYNALGPLTKTGDRALGAYQVMGANVPSWTKGALGQSLTQEQFLANPGAQDAVFSKYFGSSLSRYGNPSDAASVWFSGRPLSQASGASDGYNTGAQYVAKFNAELSKAPSALTGLTSSVGSAANGLGTLGNGLGKFGQALASAQTSGNGGLASLLGSLTGYGQSVFNSTGQFANAISSGGVGLYDGGGWTGYGGVKEPAGVVHRGEVVWSQADVARVGGPHVAEAIRLGKRGYDTGGAVDVAAHPYARIGAANGNAAGSMQPVSFSSTVINNSSAKVTEETTTDQRGGRQVKYVLADQVGDAMSTRGGGAAKTLKRTYGVKRQGIPR